MLGQVTPDLPEILKTSISNTRLRKFRATFGGDSIAATRLYLADIELASATYELLHFAELCLRQNIHQALSQGIGDNWLEDPLEILDARSRKSIASATSNVTPIHLNSDKVVAGLNFGFWNGLLDRGGPMREARTQTVGENASEGVSPLDGELSENEFADYEKELWEPYLSKLFPELDRTEAAKLTKRVRRGRNRVSHHEPLAFGINQPGEKTRSGKHVRQSLVGFVGDLRAFLAIQAGELNPWLEQSRSLEALLESDELMAADDYARNHLRNVHWVDSLEV